MYPIEKANSASALANMATRVAIRTLKAAIVEMKEMRDSGEVPGDCMPALAAHLNLLKQDKNDMRAMLVDRHTTCADFVACLEDVPIIVPQDGGK
ncbi:MAG: hypothetical protein GY807_21115 [Gammaproteobacteria bacterium]|nr:hypothetical protein [Gammaproteobacteria bacterium]